MKLLVALLVALSLALPAQAKLRRGVAPIIMPTASLTANPALISSGASSTLTWASGDASNCTGTNFSTGNLAFGSTPVSPTVTTPYSVNCAGAVASATVTIAVPTASLSASPTTIASGGSSTLTWSSTGATSCTGTNFSTGGAPNNAVGVSVSPTSTTIYSVNCAGAVASATVTVTTGGVASNEVFVGPFANWMNVKTTSGCGATGNGSTDDTTAIQNCINKLGSATPVLYFPPGTYKITSALLVPVSQPPQLDNYSIIGATPAPTCSGGVAEAGTVCIIWGGAANSATMLQTLDTFSARINRVTFNGMTNVASAILSSPVTNFSGVEIADDVFTGFGGTYNGGVAIDFPCGYTIGASSFTPNVSNGCAQIAFLRNKFSGGSWGFAEGNQNAGDVWFWYNTFTNKVIGINANKGDIQAYYNNFFNSSTVDINNPWPNSEQNIDWNYSTGSNQFFNCSEGNFFATYFLEGNTVVNTTSPQAIDCFNQGPTLVIDNSFYSKAGNGTPVVRKPSATTSDLFTAGNTFSTIAGGVLNPGTAVPPTSTCNSASNYVQSVARCNSVGDQTTSGSPPSAPSLPGTPPQYCASGCPNTVTVFEETTARTTAQIQADINSACPAGSTAGSVVHLQAGNYGFNATITVPGNSYCQIIGDGFATALAGGNPVFSCGTACKAVFRDFYVNGGSYVSNGIRLTGADQAGGRVFGEEFSVQQLSGDGIFVNGLAHANVELHDGGLNDIGYTANVAGKNSVNVVGGSGTNASVVKFFDMNGTCTTNADAQTSGNATLVWRHNWHDAGGCTAFNGHSAATITGTGSFTVAGMRPYLWGTPGHYYNLTNFSGTSAIMSIFTEQGVAPADEFISGSVAGQNLSVGYAGCQSPVFTDTATNDAYALLNPQLASPVGCNVGAGQGTYVTQATQNVPNLTTFINNTLAPLRNALPTVPGASGDPALAPNITDTRLYRIKVQAGIIGLDVEP